MSSYSTVSWPGFPSQWGFPSSFEPESFVVAHSELVFEVLTDPDVESRALAPPDIVGVVPDVRLERSTVSLVALVARRGGILGWLIQ